MKSLKWVTIITCICFLLSLLALIVFFLLGSCWDLGYDISLAIFGSSILGFIMSLVQYFAKKRKSMETFHTQALSVLIQLKHLSYFKFDYDETLMTDVIREEILARRPNSKAVFIAKPKLINKIKKEHENKIKDPTTLNRIVNDDYKKLIDKTIDNMQICAKKYIDFSHINYEPLNSAFGDLDFIFSNRTTRNFAYEKIYTKLQTARNVILLKNNVFKGYLDGTHHNIPVTFSSLLDLNKRFFTSETVCTEDIEIESIYSYYHDDISQSLNIFSHKIYNQKFIDQESIPIIQYYKYV